MAHVSVIAAGMVTPVGFNYGSSCAAIRAGISGIKQSHLWDSENGDYISAGKVPLPQWWEGIGKLADLVAPAIWECLEAAKPENTPSSIPIFLGIAPPDRPHRFVGLDEELLNEVEWRLNLPHHPESRTIPMGNVSGAIALRKAQEVIDRGLAKLCVVAGVDSFVQQDTVEAYMRYGRIMTQSNSNGFFPGEAGCAVLVGSTPKTSSLRTLGLGDGLEPSTVLTEDPFRASGLPNAVRNALRDAGLNFHDTSHRITDLSGEHYGFKEAAIVYGRLLRQRLPALHEIWHPIEFLGEIGAAIGPCIFAICLHAGVKGYQPGSRTLCHFGGDGPERAACVFEFLGEPA